MALQILQLQAGQADNFTYLVWCPATLKAMVVDPSFAPELLLEAAEERGLHIHILANTHGHRDHIAGNDGILKATGAVLAASPIDLPQAQEQLSNGSRISLGEEQIEVWHTPGHTPGSVIFKIGDAVITGDTLFVSRCGRADLPGGDVEALYRSLQRIKKLPRKPGSIQDTTMGRHRARPLPGSWKTTNFSNVRIWIASFVCGWVKQNFPDRLLPEGKDALQLAMDRWLGHRPKRPERQSITNLVFDHGAAILFPKSMGVYPTPVGTA